MIYFKSLEKVYSNTQLWKNKQRAQNHTILSLLNNVLTSLTIYFRKDNEMYC